MNGHPFDSFSRLLARGVSRREMLRGLAALTASAAAYTIAPLRVVVAGRHAAQETPEPEVPPFWPPENPLQPPGEVIDDYVDCISAGNDPEACDTGIPWCDLRSFVASRAFGNLIGLIEITPFLNDCDGPDCLQCCYVPRTNGCHSSYIGEDVINCNPRTYGAGTRGVGLTLLLQEPPPDATCLFTPQICAHLGMCQQETVASGGALASGTGNVSTQAENYLVDPRAVSQRARVFATYALVQARHYLDEYATDSPDVLPLQSLNDAVLGRGWPTWRQDMAALTFDLDDPLWRVVDSAGNTIPSASRANIGRLFALLRLLSGLPNLEKRLEYVESQVWSTSAKAAYLANLPDPDQALQQTLDPHIVAMLKRNPMLQDYRLLAAALPGENSTAGSFGGITLGTPPALRLTATGDGPGVTLSATLDDPHDSAGLARPLSVDWGDGRVTLHELPSGQSTIALDHTYGAASRYAIYAVAANNSGLRGAACAVVETQTAPAGARQATTAATPTLVRAGVSGPIVSNLPFTKDLRLALYFTAATGQRFRAGRSRIASGPTNITVPVELGDAYAHNSARLEVNKLTIEPRHGITAPSARRTPALTLSTLLLGVFSTAQLRVVERSLALSVDLLAVYLQGETTPLPPSTLTVNGDGSISVPLLYRASSTAPWQRIERIEIAVTPAMFDGFVLDQTPAQLPSGTRAAWVELRPNAFTPLADEPQQPPATPTPPPGVRGEPGLFVPMAQK